MPDYLKQPIELSKPEIQIKESRYDFDFIITEERLKSILSNICNELQHPVTIININKNYEESRIDSNSIYFSLRTSCETLRLCASSELCKKCDYHHASIFKKVTKTNINEQLIKNINSLNSFEYVTSYYKQPKIKYIDNKRPIVMYDCPMLGYRELIFPIFFEDNAIAVMFVGEINIDNNSMHRKVTEEFLKKYITLFTPYLEVDNNCNIDEIKNDLINANFINNYNKKYININNDPIGIINNVCKKAVTELEFEELCQKACKQVEELECLLKKHMMNKRKAYFLMEIKKQELEYFSSIQANTYTYNDLKNIWYCLRRYFDELSKKFDFSNVIVFSDNVIENQLQKQNNIVFSLLDTNLEMNFNFSNIDKYINVSKFSPTTSNEKPELWENIKPNYNIIPQSYAVAIAFEKLVVVIEFKKIKHREVGHIYELLLSELSNSISRIYTSIQSKYLGYYKANYQMTLRLYKHECQHISRGLLSKSKKYFKNKDYVYLNRKKAEDIYNDLKSSINLLNGMTSSINLLVGKTNTNDVHINKYDVSPFKDIIYKWTDMFSLILSENNIQLILPEVSMFDTYRPFSIHTNRELLEQVVYNIVDNAVKYAIWGSKITIDFTKPFERSSVATILIRNYSIHDIPIGGEAYQLYSRGNSQKSEIGGEGIGLYISRQIANILDMELYHKSYEISKYNIPMAYEYLNRDFKFNTKNLQLFNNLKQEIDRLKGKNDGWNFYDIVNLNKTQSISSIDIAESTIIENVCKPTYLIEFFLDVKVKDL